MDKADSLQQVKLVADNYFEPCGIRKKYQNTSQKQPQTTSLKNATTRTTFAESELNDASRSKNDGSSWLPNGQHGKQHQSGAIEKTGSDKSTVSSTSPTSS